MGKFCLTQSFTQTLKMLQLFIILKNKHFPSSSLLFLPVHVMVATKQHEVFSINLSTYRDLNQKWYFLYLHSIRKQLNYFFWRDWVERKSNREINVYLQMMQVSTDSNVGANLHVGLRKLEITVSGALIRI